jgi:nucleoside-diphosphate-sugar epimerase
MKVAINIEGSKNVFLGAFFAGVKKIIYASSIAAYGQHIDNPEIMDEDTPLRPNQNWYYSKAKGQLEFYLDDALKGFPQTTVIRFRLCIFIGEDPKKSFAKLFPHKYYLILTKVQKIGCD